MRKEDNKSALSRASTRDDQEVRFTDSKVSIQSPISSKVDIRTYIRKSLLKTSESRGNHSLFNDSDSDDETGKKRCCKCAKKLRNHFSKRLRVFNEVSATNLKIRTGAEAGVWDTWGVYYCSNRFGKHANLNPSYFFLAALFIISQGSMLNLIYYMGRHGGPAFLVVLAMVYITMGYPLYLLETMMGQYSGRKPLFMLRFMLPAFTGLGPALYLRTIIKAVNALGTFIYCLFLALSLFFCKTDNVLIYRFVEAESRNKKFNLLFPEVSRIEAGTLTHNAYYWPILIVTTIILFVLVTQNLMFYGELARIVVVVVLFGMFGYLFVGMSRIGAAETNSIVFIPFKSTFKSNWKELYNGQAWLDAMIFVIQSMELGTLVHPYLGSKNFFHYRSHRDGIYLIVLSYFWNVATALAALAWLGYIGVNRKEMDFAHTNLFGHYGLVIVFMLKHLQAEMTQNVQGDVLFFNGCFYAMIGIAAICAFVVYVIIIVDCSFPESGQLILKITIMAFIVIIYGFVVPVILLHDEGLRRLIYLNFYVHKNWSAFFVVACYFAAVAFGHDSGKFVHDFLNIIHLEGYQSKQHSYYVPRVLRYFVLTFLLLGMISVIFIRPFPHEGQTDWSGSGRYLGIAFSCLPLLVIVTVAIYFRAAYGKQSLKPHRDWFKNKYHKSICFADFENFKGIPSLIDPPEEPAPEPPTTRRHSR